MTNTTHTITRKALTGGKFEYRVDGVIHTAKSGREYTWASVYSTGQGPVIFLHARADLATKGSSDARRCGFIHKGITEITAA